MRLYTAPPCTPVCVCITPLFFFAAVAIAAAVGLAASQPTLPNLPELIAGNRDLNILARVLETNGLIPTLSG